MMSDRYIVTCSRVMRCKRSAGFGLLQCGQVEGAITQLPLLTHRKPAYETVNGWPALMGQVPFWQPY